MQGEARNRGVAQGHEDELAVERAPPSASPTFSRVLAIVGRAPPAARFSPFSRSRSESTSGGGGRGAGSGGGGGADPEGSADAGGGRRKGMRRPEAGTGGDRRQAQAAAGDGSVAELMNVKRDTK
jgi:hypothetical protein